jgi:hypothetical protein
VLQEIWRTLYLQKNGIWVPLRSFLQVFKKKWALNWHRNPKKRTFEMKRIKFMDKQHFKATPDQMDAILVNVKI